MRGFPEVPVARPENSGPRNRASGCASGWQKRGHKCGDGKGVGTDSEGQDSPQCLPSFGGEVFDYGRPNEVDFDLLKGPRFDLVDGMSPRFLYIKDLVS